MMAKRLTKAEVIRATEIVATGSRSSPNFGDRIVVGRAMRSARSWRQGILMPILAKKFGLLGHCAIFSSEARSS